MHSSSYDLSTEVAPQQTAPMPMAPLGPVGGSCDRTPEPRINANAASVNSEFSGISRGIEKKETKYLVIASYRCPLCDERWTMSFAGTKADADAEELCDPVKRGLSHLCGKCEVRRSIQCFVEIKKFGANQRLETWGEDDERRAWAKLRSNPQDYRVQVKTSRGPIQSQEGNEVISQTGVRVALQDDKQSELDRVFGRPPKPCLTVEMARKMGYNLGGYPIVGHNAKPKAPEYAGGTAFRGAVD